MSEDPYVDPATGVLINLLGFDDAEVLSQAEADIATARLHQLQTRPIVGGYDVTHLQMIHRHLFGDIYPWAGDFRTVNISRSASFGDWRHVRRYLDGVFEDLANERHLADLAADALAARLAFYLGEVNAAHPFREGNGRTQRAFFGQLCREAGWILRWSSISPAENDAASEASLSGDPSLLERLLRRCLSRV